jgi:UDP-GlcNAc3NAcA epimerase
MKILHIVGARPQFMKLASLFNEFETRNIYQKILHTGQHFDDKMSKIFFDEFELPEPDFNLNINSLTHGAMTGRMIEEIEKILLVSDFNYVITYGDTNSTLAGALAAKKIGIKVVHIESGVRNNDNHMPEEINRVLTDRISDLLFCATDASYKNLLNEGYSKFDCLIKNVGDLMLDCSQIFENKIKNYSDSNYILVTCHRASNTTKEKLVEIVEALNIINQKHKIIFSIHPRTKKIMEGLQLNINFKCIEPTGYFEFLGMLKNCRYLITDSGGAVREAYFFRIPSLLILESPLWPELTESKVCFNCKPQKKEIVDSFFLLQDGNYNFDSQIFGTGNARKLIVDSILEYDN